MSMPTRLPASAGPVGRPGKAPARRAPSGFDGLLALQATAGNQAVSRLIAQLAVQRDDDQGCVFQPEDDGAIQGIINDTEAAHLLPNRPDGTRPYPYFDVKAAAADLKGQRSDDCCNTNLASAEHYMFARYLAGYGIGNPIFMAIQAGSYYLFKLLAGSHLDDLHCPRTPPSYTQFSWAMKGSVDGTADLL